MRIIKLVWYFWFWTYVRIALSFYYKKIKISGKENIPKNAPVIFGSNHENALIDPLIMTTRFPLMIHYLVRADVFNNPFIKKFLNSLNLMPVYRIRDGVNSVKANEVIFRNCFRAFAKKEHLILFPEAAHDERRQLKIAKKGIARIALGAMHEPDAPEELYIVPVGMNYSKHQTFRSAVHIVYGEPIKVNKIEQSNENIEALKKQYDQAVAKCYVSFPRDQFEVLDKVLLHDLNEGIPIEPAAMNARANKVLEKIDEKTEQEVLSKTNELKNGGLTFPFEKRPNYFLNLFIAINLSPFALIGMVLHAPGLLLPWYIMKGVKDKIYKDTIFFGVGLVLMPITWLSMAFWIISQKFDFFWAIGMIGLMPLSLIAFSSMIRNWRLFKTNQHLASSENVEKTYQEFLETVKAIVK